MVTRVGLESYEVMASHGVFDYERETKQPFIVSIWATLADDVAEDDINQNYEKIKTIEEKLIDNGYYDYDLSVLKKSIELNIK